MLNILNSGAKELYVQGSKYDNNWQHTNSNKESSLLPVVQVSWKNDVIPNFNLTLISKWEVEHMQNGGDIVSKQDVFKVCLKLQPIPLSTGYNFKVCIRSFLLKNILRKLTV